MRLAALLCVLGLASACAEGRWGLPAPTRPAIGPSPAPPPAQAPPVINVDQEVMETPTFHGDPRVFELTAPSDGTLVARVRWEQVEMSSNDGWRTDGSVLPRLRSMVIAPGKIFFGGKQ